MIKLFFAVIFITIFVGTEASYECLQTAIQKNDNSSCVSVNSKNDTNRDEYARLLVECTKEQYLNNGCNETEWIHACTRNVAEISTSPNISTKFSFKDLNLMWKYCNEGSNDTDYECFTKIETSLKHDDCNILATNISGRLDIKISVPLWLACFKTLYVKEGCNEDEWERVCNRHTDKCQKCWWSSSY